MPNNLPAHEIAQRRSPTGRGCAPMTMTLELGRGLHDLIGGDRDENILRGFAAMGYFLTRDHFVLRTDNLTRLRHGFHTGDWHQES
jgi:hypothetical protein